MTIAEIPVGVVVLPAIISLTVGVFLVGRKLHRERPARIQSLFSELCQTHEMNADERRTLTRLASRRGLAEPAVLFIDPRLFQESDADGKPCNHLIAALRHRLFGDIKPN